MKSRFLAFFLSILVTVLIFVIPFHFGSSGTKVCNEESKNELKFTLQKYNVINKSKHSQEHNKSTTEKKVVPVSKDEDLLEIEHSTPVNEIKVESDTHGVDDSEKAKTETLKKKKKNKSVVYEPDFTIDKRPIYPASCRRMGQEGKVSVVIYVDKSGKILNILPAMSSGYKALDDAAIAAIKCWNFAKLNLQDEMNIIRTEVIFELN